MTISVRCDCGAKLKAKDSLAGKKVKCPKCKQPLLIPAAPTPEAATTDALPTGGEVDDPLGLSAGGGLGDLFDPLASDDLGGGLGLPANDAAAATGDALDLGDLSEFDMGGGGALPLGAPMQLPAYAASPAPSPAKKSQPAIDNKMVLIAAIGGGGALLLLLVGGLVAWMVFSGGSEVAENSPANSNPNSAPVAQSSAPDPQAQAASGMSSQPGPGASSDPYAGAMDPASQAAMDPASQAAMDPASFTTSGFNPQPAEAGSNTATASASNGNRVPPTSASATTQVKIRDDNGLKMKFCLCPPGKFIYTERRGEAEITNEFWIGQTEVTQSQWTAAMQTTPWTEQKVFASGDNYPASSVSWHDAMAFCERMTEVERQQGRLEGDLEYRLPTEAEWTHVSRAPSIDASTGEPHKLSQRAWYKENGGGRVHEVGETVASTWGVHDILGNVREWTLDRFATSDQAKQPVYGGPNPLQWYDVAEGARNQLNMARGGDYANTLSVINYRGLGTNSTSAFGTYGFRVVLAPPAKPTDVPEPSSDEVWFVLSNLRTSPSLDVIELSVDWKLVQGRPQPGKKYLIYVQLKVINGFVSKVESIEFDPNAKQGTAEAEVRATDPNGLLGITHVVVGDEEGRGLEMLASGELKLRGGSTDPKPPAR